jgi:hypothetical protein
LRRSTILANRYLNKVAISTSAQLTHWGGSEGAGGVGPRVVAVARALQAGVELFPLHGVGEHRVGGVHVPKLVIRRYSQTGRGSVNQRVRYIVGNNGGTYLKIVSAAARSGSPALSGWNRSASWRHRTNQCVSPTMRQPNHASAQQLMVNTVRGFSTHGQQSAAKGSSTTVFHALTINIWTPRLMVWSGGGA